MPQIAPKTYKPYSSKNLAALQQRAPLSRQRLNDIRTAAAVLPFRTNNYVVDELIDWRAIPSDPIFQLTFPQPGMLDWQDQQRLRALFAADPAGDSARRAARAVQLRMNPHPAGQVELNVPHENGREFIGMQHKYPETVLFFPTQGQTCHAYCTYCFRWPQFVGLDHHRFATNTVERLVEYLELHPEITDVLITGGDPLFMKAGLLARYLDPLIQQRPGGLATIRIGSKSLAYWPYRFVTDPDADDLLALFEKNRCRRSAPVAHEPFQPSP